MKKRFVSVSVMVVTALTLLLAGVDVASGFTTGNEVNIQFDETSPASMAGVANGTFTLGAAVTGHPGVFHVATFSVSLKTTCADCGVVFSAAGLLFNANTLDLSGTATGLHVGSGGGVHTDSLKLAATAATWTLVDTKVQTGAKQIFQGTYTLSAVPVVSLYDDFTVPPINPGKWFGDQFTGGDGRVTEGVRMVQGSGLRLFSRTYGGTGSDTGTAFGGFRLAFVNPDAIHAIRAIVQVLNFESTGCGGNPSATYAAALVGGFFFNTGTPTPGDATGDVHADVSVFRVSNSTDAPKVLEIIGNVVQCTNQSCLGATPLPGSPVSLGKVGVGVPVRLFVAWDQAKKQFLFQRGANVVVAVPYTVSDGAQPGVAFKRLDSMAFVANCTTSPRPEALMDIRFDHVEINMP